MAMDDLGIDIDCTKLLETNILLYHQGDNINF